MRNRRTIVEPMASAVADTGGVCFVPAFVGLGSPHWNPNARGTIVGLVWAAGYNASTGRPARTLGLARMGVNGFDPETGKLVKQIDQTMRGPMGHDRHDNARTGTTKTKVPAVLVKRWQTKPGPRASAPVIAAGIFLYALDPRSGKVVHQKRVYGPFGENGFPIQNREVVQGMSIEGFTGDILIADDKLLYLRHQACTPDLSPVALQDVKQPHVIPSHGFLEAIPQHRFTGKAIALAGDVVFVAGTPVAFPENDLAKAYEGRMGGTLWAASAATGEKLDQYTLDAPPAWDSLAAAHGLLVLTLADGRVVCMGP